MARTMSARRLVARLLELGKFAVWLALAARGRR